MFRKSWLCLILLLALVAGGYTTTDAQAKVPRYEKAPCPFDVPYGRTIECGYVTVREDRSDPTSGTIRLAVAVLRVKNPLPDPVVYLEGGPGGSALKAAKRIFGTFAAFIPDRDFILFDQRGIGYSQPALDCPEHTRFLYDTLDKDALGYGSDYLDVIRTCHDRLTDQGVNLWAYTTAFSAADINDMRTALGYKTWNLFGVSYGTRLALVAMRSFPQGLRSVVLDSPIPPQLEPAGKHSLTDSVNVLLDFCARDRRCYADYTGLKTQFYSLVARLQRSPVMVSAPDPNTGKQYNVLINGEGTMEALYYGLYSTKTIPSLPQIISDAIHGDYSQLGELVLKARLFGESDSSLGASMSIGCSENLFSTQLCKYWDALIFTRASTRPVTSTLPTLALSGEFDPITPPNYGRATVKTLQHGFFFEFPGMGHAVTFADDCPRSIMRAFLKAPTRQPDANCISKMTEPHFWPSDF